MKTQHLHNHLIKWDEVLATICFLFILGLFCTSVSAGELVQIKLTDGSVISGEIVSFKEGVYTIKSNILGTIKINESKIQIIRSKSHAEDTGKLENTSNTSINTQVQALQKSIMNDQEIMNMILFLQNDPDFQEILKDPAIINAVSSGDINTLMSNPKFMKLLTNPKFQEIKKKIVK